jgi:hypothetical protein
VKIQVFVFGIRNGRLLHILNSHTATVSAIYYSYNTQYFVLGSIRIWKKNGQLLHILSAHTAYCKYCLLLF